MAIDRAEIRRMAGGQLPARDAPAGARRRRHLLGRAPLGVPVRGAEALAGALRCARLHRSDLAEGVRRRGLFARGRGDSSRRKCSAHPCPAAAGQLRHLDARPRAPEIRLAGAESRPTCRASRAAKSAGARAIPNPAPARTSPPCAPRPKTRATLPRQRAEDLDLLRRQGRLDFLPRAHRSRPRSSRRASPSC